MVTCASIIAPVCRRKLAQFSLTEHQTCRFSWTNNLSSSRSSQSTLKKTKMSTNSCSTYTTCTCSCNRWTKPSPTFRRSTSSTRSRYCPRKAGKLWFRRLSWKTTFLTRRIRSQSWPTATKIRWISFLTSMLSLRVCLIQRKKANKWCLGCLNNELLLL